MLASKNNHRSCFYCLKVSGKTAGYVAGSALGIAAITLIGGTAGAFAYYVLGQSIETTKNTAIVFATISIIPMNSASSKFGSYISHKISGHPPKDSVAANKVLIDKLNASAVSHSADIGLHDKRLDAIHTHTEDNRKEITVIKDTYKKTIERLEKNISDMSKKHKGMTDQLEKRIETQTATIVKMRSNAHQQTKEFSQKINTLRSTVFLKIEKIDHDLVATSDIIPNEKIENTA